MKRFYFITKKFFPRVNTNNIKPIKSKDNTNKTEEEIKDLIANSDSPQKLITPKEFAKINTQSVKFDKSKKDFPLLFSSEDEDEFDHIEVEKTGTPKAHIVDEEKLKYTSYDTILHVPDNIQKSAKKIFSKYKSEDIREWTKKYLLLYSQNHAVEPPLDLSKLKKVPFGNSDELDIKTKIFKSYESQSTNIEDKYSNIDKEKEQKKDSSIESSENQDFDPFVKKYFKKKDTETNVLLRIEYTPPFAIAYLYSRLPQTYNILIRILKELKLRNPSFQPESILDYGAGLGSGILASIDIFDNKYFKKVAAVEPNKYMRKLGKYVTEHAIQYKDKNSNVDIMWVDSLAMLPGSGGMERGKYDLIILSHVLQEVLSGKSRNLIIDTLLNRLSNNGVLVIVEPGSPKGFRFINDTRELIREKINDFKQLNTDNQENNKEINFKETYNILAPCSHALECPLANHSNSWCHFSQLSYKYTSNTFPRIRAERDLINEKYSYLVIKKGDHILNRIDNILDESQLTIAEQSYNWSRVVRPRIKGSRHVIIDLCSRNGKLERRIVSHSHGREGGYKIAKNIKWGDLWFIPQWLPNKFRKEGNKGKRLW